MAACFVDSKFGPCIARDDHEISESLVCTVRRDIGTRVKMSPGVDFCQRAAAPTCRLTTADRSGRRRSSPRWKRRAECIGEERSNGGSIPVPRCAAIRAASWFKKNGALLLPRSITVD
ncbi:unnamed protein product [Lampetra fluviatilis]